MVGKLLKLYAYTQAPKTTFVLRHPVKSAQWVKVPFDLKHAYAPRLTALATALLVGPLAFRLGKRAARGTLFTPRAGVGAHASPVREAPSREPREAPPETEPLPRG